MRWAIEDGVPVAATALKNGKLALGFQGEVVTYDLDGYRQGVLFDGDAFPGGAEFWDMQLDEKGKLWLVTDNGLAVKYKRPGKVDYQVQWTDLAVSAPRFTVREDMLHITNLGKILKVDALEVKAQAELGDEEDLGLDE
jgi:ligand-binding sensor domain-containing protein